MAHRSLERASIPLLLALLVATPAAAEIYKHVDANGTIVFTNRGETLATARRWDPAPVQRFSRTEGQARQQLLRPADSRPEGRAPSVQDHAAETRVRFQRSGSLMLVDVRLNDEVVAPFYVDSGCSGISLTREVATQLGLDRQPARGVQATQTANGLIQLARVELDSVALGSARVVGVEATVNPHLPVGLLGGAFLNHFVYSVDPASGLLILVPRRS